jgi:SAM-dependent methyltransferase
MDPIFNSSNENSPKRECQSILHYGATPPHLGGHQNLTHLDCGVLDYLICNFQIHTFVDVGCGPGGMVYEALKRGISAIGIDGDPAILKVTPVTDQARLVIHDFRTGTAPLVGDFDLAWSIEFLEHVDECYAGNYLSTFQQAKYIFCTAAPPKARGYHHVNCQSTTYWIKFFEQGGFRFCPEISKKLKVISTMKREFVQRSGMFFRRQ